MSSAAAASPEAPALAETPGGSPAEGGEGLVSGSEGDPFPLPSPLPPEALPRRVEGGLEAQPGAGPVELVLGGKGTEDGRFAYPRAMIATPGGVLFVADKTGRIQKFSPEGRLLALARTPGIVQGKPTGLGLDPEGHLLVADTHYSRVLTYTQDLELVRYYGAPGRVPGRLMMITSVRCSAAGFHYTTDFGDDVARVQVFRADGTFVRTWGSFGEGPLGFKRPMNLALDESRGRVYVADAANHRVGVFDLEGGHLAQLGGPGREPGQLEYPYDVKLDEEGRVWVAEFGNQRVSVFDPEGAFLGAWGAPGRAVGGLNRPWALALGPQDRVWVLDSNGDRCYGMRRRTFLGGAR